ncbi:helix-turn-helix domain-containing protein [bacterium]|nr:helix-turn-helix domain-containing protein [bacterium]
MKKPRTKIPLFEMKGNIPKEIIDFIKTGYTVVFKEDEEELVDLMETDWYKETQKKMNPGTYLKIYRENFGYSQAKLGKMLGGLSRQNISGMENNRRGISKETAKKLAEIFKVAVERFI